MWPFRPHVGKYISYIGSVGLLYLCTRGKSRKNKGLGIQKLWISLDCFVSKPACSGEVLWGLAEVLRPRVPTQHSTRAVWCQVMAHCSAVRNPGFQILNQLGQILQFHRGKCLQWSVHKSLQPSERHSARGSHLIGSLPSWIWWDPTHLIPPSKCCLTCSLQAPLAWRHDNFT